MVGYHKPVLLKEAIDALNVRDARYLDCTLGDGGHSIEIIKRGGMVIGIDVDPEALGRAQKRFKDAGIDKSRFKLVQGNFRDVKNLISPHVAKAMRGKQTDLKDQKFAGAIFDLGVSSLQLENPERGFSFSKEGPLDMRMDPSLQVRALDLVNILSRKEHNELFSKLGQEKYSRAISDALVSAREIRPIVSTRQLADIVEGVVGRRWKIPAFAKASAGKHPATKVFQALRIAVNDELNALKEGLDQAKDHISENGRMVVISFHSLEDRIVKNTFKKWQTDGLGEVITKKPITPSDDEIRDNPRSRSAKMRVFKKIERIHEGDVL